MKLKIFPNELNGELVELSADARVSPPGKPWLAGSAITLDRAVTNTVKFTGWPLETVWAMALRQPAAYLGLQPAGKVIADCCHLCAYDSESR